MKAELANSIGANPTHVAVHVTAPWQQTDTVYVLTFDVCREPHERVMGWAVTVLDGVPGVALLDADGKTLDHDETPDQHRALRSAAWPVAEKAFMAWKEAQRDR